MFLVLALKACSHCKSPSNLRGLLEEWALLFFGTFMAFLHVRFILAFVPFCAPVLGYGDDPAGSVGAGI